MFSNIDLSLLEERLHMADPLFQFHKLTVLGIVKAEHIARVFSNLLDELTVVCPAGREFSLVKTKLEEASFFAKKAMANDPSNQEI